MNLNELKNTVREMVSKRVYENIEGNYEVMAKDFMTSMKAQGGIKDSDGGELTRPEGTGWVYGKIYDYAFDYEVTSQKYVVGRSGDGYYTPYEDILGGDFDFEITQASVVDLDGDGDICDFENVIKYIDGGWNTIKEWFSFNEYEMVERDTLFETTRRQKAVQSLKNCQKNIRTIAILTSENPRYNDINGEHGSTNKERRQNIEKDLRAGNYAWFPVKGKYEGKENSFFIYNISLENALWLGKKYGQESIIFIDGKQCEYWEQNGSGKYQKTHERSLDDKIDMSNADDYYTQISRNFKFQIPFFDGSDSNKEKLDEMNMRINKVMLLNVPDTKERFRRLETSMNASSGYNRYANRGELYKNYF